MSVERSPKHNVPYHLVCYDARGAERAGERGMASAEVRADAERRAPTDVFFFSHGWNADPADAIEQYGRWVDTMAGDGAGGDRLADQATGFRPLLVGVHWPSKAWADERLDAISYDVGEEPATSASPVDPVDEFADRLGRDPGTRDAIRTIVDAAHEDAVPPTLSPAVRDAYARLNAGLGLAEAAEGARPGDDREPFDAETTYQAALLADIADPLSFGGLTLSGVLAPLRVLSFWKMKSRALSFGETGAADLLRGLRSAAPEARVHVMGHSFGCIAASAAVATAGGADTLMLVQGALSLWSFCADIPSRPGRPGYFHDIVRDGLVRGALLTTTSVHDRAVRVFYPLGAFARGDVQFEPGTLPAYGAVGTFGVRGPGLTIRDQRLDQITDASEFRPGTVCNLAADNVIDEPAGISGAHSDICHPEIARALWRAVAGIRG